MTEHAADLFKRLDPDGRYENVEQIGSGGMGTVYRALDTRLLISVAIKVLHQSSAQALVRFQQEARALSALQHDGIVKIYDFFACEEGILLIMEFVDGKTVRQILDEQGVFEPHDAIIIALEISRAIKHAHANGIIHRDLKPDNVMVTADGAVKVLDFGIAKLLQTDDVFGTLTRAGQLIGSPLYMSPEQLQGQQATAQTDIYGLGLLLFHMLTDRSPFRSETVSTMLEERLQMPPSKVAEFIGQEKLGQEIDRVLAVALAPEPGRRYRNMAAFESDLNVLKSLTSDSSYSPPAELKPPSNEAEPKPKSAKVALLAIPLVLISVLFIVTAVFLTQPSDTEKLLKGPAKSQHQPIEILPQNVEVDEPESGDTQNPDVALPGFTSDDDNGTRTEKFSKAREPITKEKIYSALKANIRYLSFEGSATLNEEYLRMLKDAPIYALDLRSTATGIGGMKALRELPKLNWLILSNSDFSDTGADALGPMPNLRKLELHNCRKFSDRGLMRIVSAYPKLKLLDIGETSITTLKPLKELRHLQLLRAGRTEITDEDIACLREPLRTLYIIGCPNITDQSLASLAQIKTLNFVSLKACPKISVKAIRKFIASTGCRVSFISKQAKQPKVRDAIKDSFAELDSLDENPSSNHSN
jgi:serine/threonine protein kinase